VFCLASLHEGFPNALAEALACGKPCIATAISGSSEMIRDGESGSLIAVGDSQALARCLLAYLRDPQLASTHGAAARTFIRATYSVERMVQRYCELYREVLSGAAG
jgi:glycosyltransferase involved in cell wall biosynthesis